MQLGTMGYVNCHRKFIHQLNVRIKHTYNWQEWTACKSLILPKHGFEAKIKLTHDTSNKEVAGV